jgi:hypothetical protein
VSKYDELRTAAARNAARKHEEEKAFGDMVEHIAHGFAGYLGCPKDHGERTWIIDYRTVDGGDSRHPSPRLCACI